MIRRRSSHLAAALLAASLAAGCELLVPFESVPEGAGGTAGVGGTAGAGAAGAGGTAGAGGAAPQSCRIDRDCDGAGPCSAASCQNGQCTLTPLNEGATPPAVEDPPGDCLKPVCQGGALVDVPDEAQSPDTDPTDCMVTHCTGDGGTATEPVGDGAPCGEQPARQCQKSACQAGDCVLQDLPDGTVIAPGDTNIPSGGTDCRDLVCKAGQPVLQPNFMNCKDLVPGNCTVPSCNNTGECKFGGMAAPAGQPCDTNGDGIDDGVCDGLGTAASNCKPG